MWSKIIVVALATASSLNLPNTNPNVKGTVTKNEQVIYWSPQSQLLGTDFKRAPVEQSRFSAGSHLGTGLEIAYSPAQVKFSVKAYFVPDKSWIKVHDADLLKHEQTHFDIEEYYARLIRKELKKIRTKGRSFEDIRKEADEVFNRMLNERELLQEKFDEETGHSVHIEKEKEWEHKIQKGLQETQYYASPEIVFTM